MPISIKVNPARLPATYLPPTRIYREPLRTTPPVETFSEIHDKRQAASTNVPKRETTIWTAERDELLKNLIRQGKTFREAGKELGVSKGAINSRMRRLRQKGDIA